MSKCSDPVGYFKCVPDPSELCAGDPPSYHEGVAFCPRSGHAVCHRTNPRRKRVRAKCAAATEANCLTAGGADVP